MIHGHGDDLYRSNYEVRANFSTNVWYGADLEGLFDYLKGHLKGIGHYPEPDAGSFRKVAAFYHGLREENVLAGNGATELFYLIAHAFAGGKTLLPVPSFMEYEDACRMYGHELVFLPLKKGEEVPDEGDLVFICNPNNPDGRIWSWQEIRALLVGKSERVVVVDESFIHFAPGADSVIPLLGEYPNLLVVCSMTKCYAIPGLRLGYILGSEALIERLKRFSLPWSVNVLAIEAGKYLLRHGDEGLPDARLLLERQRRFSEQVGRIPGFRPLPSGTSFFLTETDYDSGKLKQYLLKEHGLLIRDASNFRGLNNHYFRMNTLEDEKNELLIEGLQAARACPALL